MPFDVFSDYFFSPRPVMPRAVLWLALQQLRKAIHTVTAPQSPAVILEPNPRVSPTTGTVVK
jgi:hypothetical protein